jgi:hypothetical protein
MSQGFDMSKLSKGEKLVGGAAVAYIIWIFIPTWYSCCTVEGVGDVPVGGSFSGFRGFMILAWILALAAVAEIAMRKFANANFNLPMRRGQVHVILAGIALVCTLLGLVVKPGSFGVSATLSWGIFVGILIAAVWAYGAYMMQSEPEAIAPGSAPPAMPDAP